MEPCHFLRNGSREVTVAQDKSPKIRQLNSLMPKEALRADHDRILLITEGEKTEPNYFKEIRAAFRINNANIEISPSEETSPLQVTTY